MCSIHKLNLSNEKIMIEYTRRQMHIENTHTQILTSLRTFSKCVISWLLDLHKDLQIARRFRNTFISLAAFKSGTDVKSASNESCKKLTKTKPTITACSGVILQCCLVVFTASTPA